MQSFLRQLILFFAFTLTVSHGNLFAQITAPPVYPLTDTSSSSHGYCGLSNDFIQQLSADSMKKKWNNIMRLAISMNGSTSIPTVITCGRFRFAFQDVVLGSGLGFDNGVGGANMQQCVCDVANYIQSIYNIPSGDSTYIDIVFNQSWWNVPGPFYNPPPNPSLLAVAGPVFSEPNFVANIPGFYGGDVLDHFQTGTDPDPLNVDGVATINYAQPFYLCGQTKACNLYDFKSIMLHELTHALGWISTVTETAAPAYLPLASNSNNRYSLYDKRFMYYGDVTNPAPLLKIIDTTLIQVNGAVGDSALRNNKLWYYSDHWHSNVANQNFGASAVDPVMWHVIPAPNSISHIVNNQTSFLYNSFEAPGFQPRYIMGPAFAIGAQLHGYTLQEIRALAKLGYQFTASFLASNTYNTAFANGTIVTNHHPFTSKAPFSESWYSHSWGADRIDIDSTGSTLADYTISNCQTQVIALASDTTNHDIDPGDPIRIYPGSLYNIRGCGIGGNNHLCLSVASTPSGDVITYTPRANFVGRAQFGFHLYDGKERGAFKIYTIDVTSCTACPTEYVINGNFEEGGEVCLYNSGQWVENSTLKFGQQMLYETYMARIQTDGHPFLGNNYMTVENSYGCDTTNEQFGWDIHSFTSPGSSGLPPATSGAKRYFSNLQKYSYFRLCHPTDTCGSYRLQFDIAMLSTTSLSLKYGFTNTPRSFDNPPVISDLDSIQITGPANTWMNVIKHFKYCNSPTGNFLVLINSNRGPFYDLDNLSLKKDTAFSVKVQFDTIRTCKGGPDTLKAFARDSICGLTYLWKPGNIYGQQIVVHPTTSTTYKVIASNGCTSDSATVRVIVDSVIVNAGADYSICSGDSVQIGSTSIAHYAYSWSPTTGLSCSTCARPYAHPTSTTTYVVTASDTIYHCSNSDTVVVTVNPLPVTNAGRDTSICLGRSVTIGTGAITGMNYSWSPSTGLSCTTCAQPVATPTVTTTYTLTVTNSSTGCFSRALVTVTILPIPSVSPGTYSVICIGDSAHIGATSASGLTYSWSPIVGLSCSTCSNPNASPPVTTTYTLTVTNLSGCQNSDTVTVRVHPRPIANAHPGSGFAHNICYGDSILIGPTVDTANTYSWSPPTGLSCPTCAQTYAHPTGTTTYTLTVTNRFGCTAKDSVRIIVNPQIFASAGPNRNHCLGGPGDTLFPSISGGTAPYTYIWSPSSTLSCSTCTNPIASPTITTTYTLTVTDKNGCHGVSTVTVFITTLCCTPADILVPSGTNVSAMPPPYNSGSATSQTIEVSGIWNININLSLHSCKIRLDSNARINVLPGIVFTLDSCQLWSCNDMWDGIYLNSNSSQSGKVVMNNCIMEDAINGIVSDATPGTPGNYQLHHSQYNKNIYSVKALHLAHGRHPGLVSGCQFTDLGTVNSPTPTLKPHPGTTAKSFAGVYIDQVDTITVGDTSFVNTNLFDNLSYGVYDTYGNYVWIFNGKFQRLSGYLPLSHIPTGVGVYATRLEGGTIIVGSQVHTSTIPYEPCTFLDCFRGVDITGYFNIYVNRNKLSANHTPKNPPPFSPSVANTGINVTDQYSNVIDIEKNTLNNWINGIVINRNLLAVIPPNISSTLIEVSHDSISSDNSGYCLNGIYLSDAVSASVFTPTAGYQVRCNDISNTYRCITGLNIGNGLYIDDNARLNINNVVSPPLIIPKKWGIKLDGCKNSIISNNVTIYSATTIDTNVRAIHLRMSPSNVLSCNAMQNVGQDMVFEGNCLNSTIRGNIMGVALHGFVLMNNGVVGIQGGVNSPSGNQWTSSPSMIAATYVLHSPSPTLSKIYLNCSALPPALSGYTYCPPASENIAFPVATNNYQYGPLFTLITTSGSYSCKSPVPCSGKSPFTFSTLMSLYQPSDPTISSSQMVSDTTTWPSNEVPSKWIANKHVFDQLNGNSNLITADSILSVFYNNNQFGSYGQFAQVTNDLNNLNLGSAPSSNNAVIATDLRELNQKTFNSLLLQKTVNPLYIYDTTDINILYGIANQCPLIGGEAVFAARAELNFLTNSVIDFVDSCVFNEFDRKFERETPKINIVKSSEFRLYPNPNGGDMTLEYSITEDGLVYISDPEGRNLQETPLPRTANKIGLNEGSLANGVYLLTVKVRDSIYYRQKVIISR